MSLDRNFRKATNIGLDTGLDYRLCDAHNIVCVLFHIHTMILHIKMNIKIVGYL